MALELSFQCRPKKTVRKKGSWRERVRVSARKRKRHTYRDRQIEKERIIYMSFLAKRI